MPSTSRRNSADRYDDPTASRHSDSEESERELANAPSKRAHTRHSSSESEGSDSGIEEAGEKEFWDDEEAVGETSLPPRRKEWVMNALQKGNAGGRQVSQAFTPS